MILTTILNIPTLPNVMTLDRLPTGTPATVRSVSRVSSTTLRLMEMGLVPGCEVQVRKKAPFGGPIELQLTGFRLSVRPGEAEVFEVGDP